MQWSIPFSIINAKGGVGKTTTAVNVAAMAVTLGKPDGSPLKALLVDIDHQTNATQQLGYHDLDRARTLAGHVSRDADLSQIIINNG
jgi:chromosome partitioning protein